MPELVGVERLHVVARSTPDPVTALVLQLQAAHRKGGGVRPAR